MQEVLSIKSMPKEVKIGLLDKLGYSSDGTFIFDKHGKKVIDKYIDLPVRVDNMFIYNGSTVILDNNPLSISSFLEEYGDVI